MVERATGVRARTVSDLLHLARGFAFMFDLMMRISLMLETKYFRMGEDERHGNSSFYSWVSVNGPELR